MHTSYDVQAAKKSTNLSINSDLLMKAKALDINLSATLEQALNDVLRKRAKELWLLENKEAIAAYNEHIAEDGVFSEGLRLF
ncbi:MAG: type II toxin-antitoxin system CcdA family antitoxin [Gammaproteobacteria bacterium]|nr:type II toxin-antitoxin system CcdA family antitoxin [Gammaproteobacteria bacterium]